MAVLLVTEYGIDADHWRCELRARVPELDLRCWPDAGLAEEVEAVLVDTRMIGYGGFGGFGRLAWVHYLGHGVGDLLLDPSLPPDVTVTRQKRQSIARDLAIYVVQAVTTAHLQRARYRAQQQRAEWTRLPAAAPASVTIGVLGLGIIGRTIACRLRDLGYRVVGWNRTGHTLKGVGSVRGSDGLKELLPRCDFLVGVLPETKETVNLLDASALSRLKRGSHIINVGRGSLIVEPALLDSLDAGHIGGATLDVFCSEPLAPDNRLWSHPLVTVTPHTGGQAQDDETAVIDEIADNYRRLKSGEPLRNVVDRVLGY